MNSEKRFECVEECSQCCIEREYYPSKKFGKIGVFHLLRSIVSFAADLRYPRDKNREFRG